MKTIIPLDPRLNLFREFASFAISSLKANRTTGVLISKLIPDSLVDIFPPVSARIILEGFNIAKLSGKKYFPGAITVTELSNGLPKSLNLMLWFVTSQGYSYPESTSKEVALEFLLKQYGGELAYLDGCREVLACLGFGNKQAGGMHLRSKDIPRQLTLVRPEKNGGHDATRPLPDLEREYLLYKSIWGFFRKHRDAQEVLGHEYLNWKYLFVEASPGDRRLPDGENPDIAGIRVRKNRIGLPDLELMTVEAKLGGKLEKAFIQQAEGYFEYSNFVYLALNATAEQMLPQRYNYEYLLKRGLGLLLLRKEKTGKFAWYEALPPIYRPCRLSKQILRLEIFFNKHLHELKEEISPTALATSEETASGTSHNST